MADEPKSADKPVVFEEISDDSEEIRRTADRLADADAIPDAEVIQDRDEVAPPRGEPEPGQTPVADGPGAESPLEQAPTAKAAVERPAIEPVAAPPARRSGAFLGFVLGGAVAAAGGFALARFQPDLLAFGGVPDQTVQLTAQLGQQATTMTELQGRIEALGAREMPDLSGDLAALRSEVEARLASLPPAPDVAALAAEARSVAETALAGFEARLTDLENRPPPAPLAASATSTTASTGGVSAAALAAYDAELKSIKADLESLRSAAPVATDELKALAEDTQAQLAAVTAEALKLKENAEAAGRAALARAALARIKGSLDGGEPFTSAVAELTETGNEVPAVLADSAEAGIPSLTALQRSFPDVARSALDAALRADMGDSWTDRAASFLRTQTGARALAPLEGNDPDAILSRAEAVLNKGELAAALTELATLPETAKVPLADWIATAERREAATAAIAALSTALDAE